MSEKKNRLLKRGDFERLKREGKRLVGRFITLEYLKNSYGYNRLGITVTRKYGNAVGRNRFRRIVREAYRKCWETLPQSYDYVVRPRREAHEAAPSNIEKELLHLGLNIADDH